MLPVNKQGESMRSEQPEASSKETVSTSRDLFAQRLVIGILQGILLYLLLDAAHNQRAIAKLPVVRVNPRLGFCASASARRA